MVKFYPAFSVSAVPKAVVLFLSERRFVINEEHIRLEAGKIRYHFITPVPLLNMPGKLIIRFMAGEFGLRT